MLRKGNCGRHLRTGSEVEALGFNDNKRIQRGEFLSLSNLFS